MFIKSLYCVRGCVCLLLYIIFCRKPIIKLEVMPLCANMCIKGELNVLYKIQTITLRVIKYKLQCAENINFG